MFPLGKWFLSSEVLSPYLFKGNTESSSSQFHMAPETSRLVGNRSGNRHMQKVKMTLSPHQVTKKMNGALLQDMEARLSNGGVESSLRRSQLLRRSVLK